MSTGYGYLGENEIGILPFVCIDDRNEGLF